MKAIFISYDQAFHERVLETLTHLNCRGYTRIEQVQGRGSKTGEPHLGSHAWPSMCEAILSVVDDDKVDKILEELHQVDKQTEQLGLRAFVWNIEKTI
jgi:nitrogen regulatory protein PII